MGVPAYFLGYTMAANHGLLEEDGSLLILHQYSLGERV